MRGACPGRSSEVVEAAERGKDMPSTQEYERGMSSTQQPASGNGWRQWLQPMAA